MIERIKEKAEEVLDQLDVIIGWTQGYDPLHMTPYAVWGPEGLDRLVWNPLCVTNLSAYLYELRGMKVGLLVKGCDSRSVIQLINEGLINRKEIYLFGIPCEGTVDLRKVGQRADLRTVEGVTFEDGKMVLHGPTGSQAIIIREVVFDKCIGCPYPTPLLYDFLAGNPIPPLGNGEGLAQRVREVEGIPEGERLGYWKAELERCIRCYACRNACPLCVCRDFCAAESRDPHWISLRDGVKEKWLWQMLHVSHLAGRCTGCGECERACPMGIPILSLRAKANEIIKELFDYEAGVKEGERPPLLTYQVAEPKIEEPTW